MSLPQKLLLRIVIYAAICGYLYGDFFIFKGPLSRMVHEDEQSSEKKIAEAKAAGVVARAYYQPIYRTQVEERMREYLWRRGQGLPEAGVKILREAVLAELIDELLIKIQIKVSGANDYPVSEGEIEEAFARFNHRYPNLHERDLAMTAEGWTGGEKELKMRLAARLQREKYLIDQLGPFNAKEAPQSAKEWYQENQDSFQRPDDSYAPFSEVEHLIKNALEVTQRERGMDHFRKILRSKAKGKIEIFSDVLHAEDLE